MGMGSSVIRTIFAVCDRLTFFLVASLSVALRVEIPPQARRSTDAKAGRVSQILVLQPTTDKPAFQIQFQSNSLQKPS